MRRPVVVAAVAGLCVAAAGGRAGREAIGAALLRGLDPLPFAYLAVLGAITSVPALLLAFLALERL